MIFGVRTTETNSSFEWTCRWLRRQLMPCTASCRRVTVSDDESGSGTGRDIDRDTSTTTIVGILLLPVITRF